jgi:hypothetical protein
MQSGFPGIRTAGYIAIDVTTGRNGIKVCLIKCLDRRFDLCLDKAMQLERLPGGDLYYTRRIFARYIVDSNPLLRCNKTPGKT